MTYENRFQGRTAIVTGGASGIGLSVVARLTREGAKVSIWDLNADALTAAKEQATAADTQVVDVADPAQVARAMTASVAALGGKLDVLVASAGITGPNVSVRDYPADAWRQVIDVNINGLFYCNQAAVPHLERNGYGRIVNIASVAGKEGNPNAAAYSTSKAGEVALMKMAAIELARYNIRVNAVCPGAIDTKINDRTKKRDV
ncbi:MAG TPA: SDR family NAD(P)-dependent oxidoreductase, partial [Bradyrhizobium sp.]|nr:SDR family NAD(P)-dependent oxidoreductase [Bradyrhizobium sp.]